MPKIATYDAPEGIGLRPTETGINAVAGAARRLEGDYSQAAAAIEGTGQRVSRDIQAAGEVAVKAIDHQQISHGANSLAGMVAKKTQEWNDTAKNADPNDPTVAKRFLEENLEPAVEDFKKGFITEKGQQWAEAHADQFRQHMYAKTSADMSTLAGEAVKINHRQTVNSLATAAYGDPSSLDFALKTLESATEGVVGSSPNLTGTAAGAVKTELLQSGKEAIVKSAIMGMIEKNPKIDLDAIEKKYGEYLKPGEMRTFAKAAQSQAKVDAYYQKQIEITQQHQDVLAAHAAANKNMTDNVSIDPATNRPIVKPDYFKRALEIAKMPHAPDGLARTLLDWGERQQNLRDEPIRSNPAVKQDLLDRMFSTDKPTTEIDLMRAQVKGDLSHNDFAGMHQLWATLEHAPLKDPVVHETLHGVKELLGTDPVGAGKYASFVQDFVPQYLAAKKEGKLPPDALDLKNPDSMISKAMAPYQRPATQIMQDKILRGGGLTFGAPPESVAPAANVPAIPPPDKREVGRTYQTPAGPRVWRGTGWDAVK